MGNRLNLDWSLSSSIERTNFINQYINSNIFTKKPPTEEELETMANYLLWGQDENGLNSDQKKEIQLPRRNQTWATKNIESLDELLESPTFSESSIYKLDNTIPKKVKEVFSREEISQKATPDQLKSFKSLWKEIDKTELIINFYEIKINKRTKQPRPELLSIFSEEEISKLKARAEKLSQFYYLKMRHLLVELRRQQYTLRDSIFNPIVKFSDNPILSNSEISSDSFDVDFPVLPLGIQEKLLFKDFNELTPKAFNEEELWNISKIYWEKKEEEKKAIKEKRFYFDFRDLEMVYQLFLNLEDFSKNQEKKDDFFNSSPKLLRALWFYVRQAHLSPLQQKILDLKIKKIKNQEIAKIINQEFKKNYTANYISTIFRQKIIPLINAAAIYHEKIISNIFFEEEFKVCTKCGRLLLRDPINFVRRARAKDGLSNHCKKCDKQERDKKRGKLIDEE